MPPRKICVAVDDEVMGGDRRREVGPAPADVRHRLLGRDVFEDDAQFGEAAAQRIEHPLDEHRLAVEHIDLGVGDLAVDQQRHPEPGHMFQDRHDPVDVGDAVRRMGRRVRRVQLDRGEDALRMPARDLGRVGRVGQVAGHQRGELGGAREFGRQRRDDALAIGPRRRDIADRRHQVRHDDRAGELARRRGQHRPQHRPVAEMDVPVVGPADREGVGHIATAE